MKEFDLDDRVVTLFSTIAEKSSIDSYKLGFVQALELLMEEIEKETDPESWGSFALPKVRQIISKLQG